MRAKMTYVRARGTATEDLTARIVQRSAQKCIEGELRQFEIGLPMILTTSSGALLIRTSSVMEMRSLDSGEIEVHTFRSVYKLSFKESL